MLSWANDHDVRSMARNSDPITPETHSAWFTQRLADPNCRIWICEAPHGPVGQIRLVRSADMAEIDISVSSDVRGQGVATFMLSAPVITDWSGLRELVAVVRRGNLGSRALFQKAGFVISREDDEFVYFNKGARRVQTR